MNKSAITSHIIKPILCAFHNQRIITHFCVNSQCLLPLCNDCLAIHKKQHLKINGPMLLKRMQQQISTTDISINKQIQQLQRIYSKISKKYQSINQHHFHLQQQIISQQNQLIQAVKNYYTSIFNELNQANNRRQKWIDQIYQKIITIKSQLFFLRDHIYGEKPLRTIIMWEKTKFQESLQKIDLQTQKQQKIPQIYHCDIQKILKLINSSRKTTTIDFQGDFGLGNYMKLLYNLRYGEENNNNANKNGIKVASRQRKSSSNKLGVCKSVNNL